MQRCIILVSVGGALAMACHRAPPPMLPPQRPPQVTAPSDTSPPPPPPPPRRVIPRDGPLNSAERDSIVSEMQAHRAVWRARAIADYRIRVTVGCFCPWPQTPAILEVRRGVAVGLRDTTGRAFGPLREPWSIYTVEALFDAVEQGARRDDILEVTYDARLDYPTYIRGDAKLGLPDDWFWVRARLEP